MKLGLILEGGASRGYFSCGVLEALEHEKIMADPDIPSYCNLPFVFEDLPNRHLPFNFNAFKA